MDIKSIEERLIDFLTNCSSLVILGIGNDIRGDDGLGPYIINQLDILKDDLLNNGESVCEGIDDNADELSSFKPADVSLINAGSVPENFTSEIKKSNPSHIIIIDVALMNKAPGEINIVDKENIKNISVSTHSMSLSYLIKYLELDISFNVLFIAVQPEIMDLSFDLSFKVKESSDLLVETLFSIIYK